MSLIDSPDRADQRYYKIQQLGWGVDFTYITYDEVGVYTPVSINISLGYMKYIIKLNGDRAYSDTSGTYEATPESEHQKEINRIAGINWAGSSYTYQGHWVGEQTGACD